MKETHWEMVYPQYPDLKSKWKMTPFRGFKYKNPMVKGGKNAKAAWFSLIPKRFREPVKA